MSNEKIVEHLMTYGWAYLCGLIIIGAFFYYDIFNFRFDIKDDVCLQGCFYNEDKNICISTQRGIYKDYDFHIDEGYKLECNIHRRKTFCEKCIQIWGNGCYKKCICEEYEDKYYNIIITSKEKDSYTKWGGLWLEYIYKYNETIEYFERQCLTTTASTNGFLEHIKDENCSIKNNKTIIETKKVQRVAHCSKTIERLE